jgi:hypothetical protein
LLLLLLQRVLPQMQLPCHLHLQRRCCQLLLLLVAMYLWLAAAAVPC